MAGRRITRRGPPTLPPAFDPSRIQINRPVPGLWSRFGLKTPVGLSSMNLHVQPVTNAEVTSTEVNQLLQNDTEGTFYMTGSQSVAAGSANTTYSVKANTGLYLVNFVCGSYLVKTSDSGYADFVISSYGGGQDLYVQRLGFPYVAGTYASNPMVIYVNQSWNVVVRVTTNGTIGSTGDFFWNIFGNKIQGGDTLDVGRNVAGLDDSKLVAGE